MKNCKKYASLLLALVLCLSMAACGGKAGNEEVINDGKISMDDLVGYWSPVEGLGSTTSALTCIYLDAANGIWEEYDQYGDRTGYTGAASTDGTILTLSDVPLIGDVDIPIGDADTLVTDTGETYWVKGYPDFMDKPELSSSYYGNWYLRGDHDSEYATVLTLNEDGTYSWYGTEGTYTYSEFDEYVGDTTVLRQQIELSASSFDMYYLVSDGQVLVRWSDVSNGDDYYIHEDALDNASLLTEYNLTNESFSGQDYYLEFYREYTVNCYYFNGETRTGTWEMDDTTVLIFWDDGETDEAELDWKTLYMSSTGETLENPW
ncbi:MAG: hypothetical protein SOY32_04615 [Candidatus Faecousia sp.]|nr:hypothetical protein [Candidatus Faecousia sp.]